MDDIVDRLKEMLDGPVPWSIERQDVRDAIAEIERLQKDIQQRSLDHLTTIGELQTAADEIERLREQVQYRDDVIAMLRADVARLGSFLHPIGEEARRG